MNVTAYLRDTRTNVVRQFTTEYPDNDRSGETYGTEGIIFHWTEGNYGCDCNRSMFFYRAGFDEITQDVIDRSWDEELECNPGMPGDNIIVLDKLVNADTGEVIWIPK